MSVTVILAAGSTDRYTDHVPADTSNDEPATRRRTPRMGRVLTHGRPPPACQAYVIAP